MKNHIKVDGKLLQTNKKWAHLKQKQREWISQTTKEEYDRFIVAHKKQPRKSGKDEVIEAVYDKIKEKEIWIPFYEAKAHIEKYIDRYNRKPHEVTAENGEVITVAPIIKTKNKS